MENKQKSIVIVEDDEFLLEILRDEFFKAGFNVATAKDGIEGLEAALRRQPDLILIDVLMPKMDGIEMLKKIRQHPGLKTTPAVILTNLNDTQTIETALENGAYDYLVKSDWNPKELVSHVQEKLGLKQ